jgi:hypothetical protein
LGLLVQINGKLNGEKDQENNTICETTLIAKEIVAISQFNFYQLIGITAGVRRVRLNVSFQYVTHNMLGNLNNKNLGVKLRAIQEF